MIEVAIDVLKDEVLGLYFPIKVKVDSQYKDVERKYISLSSEMNVNVEIKTDSRCVMGFLLSPVIQKLDERA
ncbi:hypothetical protein N474_05470 [Pseudoalteromonas luteoviolacea CPMOR-2]|uniref:Uncharacterized protein n=1 Tax=Pseudoalteromonas luteoviolacea DSM 6061 TaxID=1365250 RepID=A0A167ABD1_9GAMM|nr:hypothetical protein [Pseudoalteromonas luteoviolacea]KZN45187.1 hypothetical protein N475_08035 [Pseudoalteromonas luteoviolacea DSM 6061]KZN60503.1 hypothetical protein N474_05470 [Pseudoalteromonas luteoviolacea CPMOR-2]MBE0386757.1 hypothetical protein [Pseudoalteromonas luteoviolacea DSM 6061]